MKPVPTCIKGHGKVSESPYTICLLLSHFHLLLKAVVSSEVWDPATWTIRSSIWFWVRDSSMWIWPARAPDCTWGHSMSQLARRPTEVSPRLGKDDCPFRLVVRTLVTTRDTLALLEAWLWADSYRCTCHMCAFQAEPRAGRQHSPSTPHIKNPSWRSLSNSL